MLCKSCEYTVDKYKAIGNIGYCFVCDNCKKKLSPVEKIIFGSWERIECEKENFSSNKLIWVRKFGELVGPRIYLNFYGTYGIGIPKLLALEDKFYCTDIHMSKSGIISEEAAKLQADVFILSEGYKIAGFPGG
ncbi:hypothetical protein N9W84_01070 [bacterium]|nr:hypothetical protein [bacterium]